MSTEQFSQYHRHQISKPFTEFSRDEVERSVPQRFEEIVQRNPQTIAIRTEVHRLTYAELNQAANRIARVLDQMGGKLSRPVIVLCEHDAPAIIAYLGVLKAGQISIAFNTSFPVNLLGALLDDAQAEIIIADDANLSLARIIAGTTRQVLELQHIDGGINGENVGRAIAPQMPAEIRYTSGSTGKPKGIVRSHRRILFTAMNRINSAHIGADDRLLIQRHLSVGGKDVMRGLLSGASVTPFDIRKYGLAALATTISQEQLTHFAFVPSTFRHFVRSLTPETQFPTVRLIELGGEPISKGDIESSRQHFSRDCVFLHKYSSGEAGNICQFFITADTEINSSVVPAGYPIEGKEVSIVDDTGAAAGVNQSGEIVVKSRYLSDGYWRAPELTNKQFIADASEPGRFGYFTGDLGRLLPDGCLIHLGRKDEEIKISGHRVAPIEIEMTLLEHTQVKDAGVAVWSRESGEKYLSAYIVPRGNQVLTAGELRGFLRDKLPDFMIPTHFVFMDDLPRTSGKLDRKNLPKPEADREQTYVAPSSELEKQLVSLFEELLERRPIGVRDNFIDLGADSMFAIQAVAKIEKLFGKQILPAALFCAPTVEQIAAHLKEGHAPQNLTSLLPAQPYGSRPPFFWVHGDHSIALLPRFLPPDQPVYGLEHQSADGNPARYRQVDAIAAHYLNEVRAVQRRGPYYIGGYSFGAVVACEMATQLAKLGEEVGLLALLDPPGAAYHRTFARARTFFNDSSRAPKSPSGNRGHSGPRKSQPLDDTRGFVLANSRRKVFLAISEIRDTVAEFLNRMLCLGAIAMKRPIPQSLRSFYILNVYHRARLKYQPLPYSGNALIFASEHRSPEHFNYWKELILGEVEYCRLPGDHDAARRDPAAVRVWAEKLRDRLSEAQANSQIASDLVGKEKKIATETH